MNHNPVEMIVKLEEKPDIERFVSIVNLGICTALENGVLTIEEAETYLYSPYTMEQLEKLDVAQELIDIVHLGTELEDIKSLIPEKLNESLEEIKVETLKFMKSVLQTTPTNIRPQKWIQRQHISALDERMTF
jgi:hypothetical protein